jgi:dienelactone hydrolase
MENRKKLSLKTLKGCTRLVFIFIAIILVSGLLGQVFQSDFGTVKTQRISVDFRGAELNGELYYPAGTSSKDKLPAIVIGHGGGCNYAVFNGVASELARRGFVVFNASAYGSGLSEIPKYDENGNGVEGLNVRTTPLGTLDSVDYVRSMAFVDPTRIGIVGHSMGAGRTAVTTATDCGFLSFNDILINVLYDEFGQTFTQDEINLNADQLAQARLNADQLAYYNSIRDTKKAYYDSRIKAYICLGGGVKDEVNPKQVTVAGFEVTRNCQSNIAYMSGEYDNLWNVSTNPDVKAIWYTDEDLVMGEWYDVDNITASSREVGTLFGTSVANDTALAKAIDNRSTRLFYLSANDTHSQEFFSSNMASAIVKYFEQTMGYNRGYLAESTAAVLDASNNIWPWNSVCNFISMLAMIGMIISLGALLLKTKTFGTCVIETPDAARPAFNKKRYWIFSAITVIIGFFAVYIPLGSSGLVASLQFKQSEFWPVTSISFVTLCLLCLLAAGSILLIAAFVFFNKKEMGKTGLRALNMGINFKNVLKSIAVAFILLAAGYVSMSVIEYFFGQDYRLWMAIFPEMKADYWWIALRYIIPYFVLFFIIGAAINYTVRKDIPQWKDTLITVVVNSLGIWICALITHLIVWTSGYSGTFFCNFFISYQFMLLVPITVYITRKMYNLTNSIWIGALLNGCLVGWAVFATGIGSAYIPQTWLGNFLGF